MLKEKNQRVFKQELRMITSTANNRIRELVKIKKSAKERAEKDVFLVEGPKMFREIPKGKLVEAYASESFLNSAAGRKLLQKTQTDAEAVSDRVFEYLSDTRSPQGILAVVSQFHYSASDLLGKQNAALLLVLENLQDPGNLGTIIRTAEAAGVTGIILSRGCADLTSPKVTRSTMGSIFRVPYIYSDNLEMEIQALKKEKVCIFAAHLQGSVEVYTESFTGPTAFMIGNESRGLNENTAKLADKAIRIPMHGQVESLNAAVASSILLYEACRQRLS